MLDAQIAGSRLAPPSPTDGLHEGLLSKSSRPTFDIVLCQTEDGRTQIECRLEGETPWLTQAEIAELFQTAPQNTTQHLRELYADGELVAEATCKQDFQARREGTRDVRRALPSYNLNHQVFLERSIGV